jgi:transcriptional regulator of acetoin/glycerol metabolism
VELSMHNLGTAERVDLVALLAVEDEELANQSPVRLLITAPMAQAVETLARRIHGAGTLLVSAVEEMPATVQDAMIDLLGGLESARVPSAMARLISGTTVSLLDRVAAGTFSERLFYRLNIIHLMVGDGSEAVLV